MRWLLVAVVALVLISVPLVTNALPAQQTGISAERLLQKIRASRELGWSGEVRSIGSVQVPVSGATFGGVARLLGGQTKLRVWWRAPETWRIDRLRTTGETDMVRDGVLTASWNYEDNRVSFATYSPIRLPNDLDVVPSALAERLLAAARPGELSRLPAQRVAGRDAAGLRLVPSDHRSTIARVDIWADESTGLPLRVEVYADPAGSVPVLTTELTSLDVKKPAYAKTHLKFSRSVHYARGFTLDAAAGANVYAPFIPPDSVAGLPRRGRVVDFGAVGVYGRGPTAVLAVPLRDSVARGLRDQLRRSARSRSVGRGVALEVGPLSVLLQRARSGNFLLAGTVTPATLRTAAADLADGVVRTR